MSRFLSALLRITALVLLACILVWFLSTDDQRRRLLVAFGLADSLAQAELTALSLVGPGFEIELLAPLPMAPTRYVFAAPQALPPAQAPAALPRRAAAGGRTLAHGDHPCAAGIAENPSRARPAPAVHRWVDASGRVVFSDHAPAGIASEQVEAWSSAGVGRFSADYAYEGFLPPARFQQQLETDIDGVFHFLADDLELRDVQPVHLKLRIIDGGRAFARAAAGAHLTASTVSGFYTFRDNQAVVRWMGDAPTRAVARHEIMHLALGNWLGRVPLWLNEGLAEVAERMRFQQSFATAAAPARELARLRGMEAAGRLPDLATFLAGDRDDWSRWGNDLAYPYAWSLVHFLLEQPSRQRTVGSLLNALADHRCRGFDQVAFLERDYVGGLPALAQDWRHWLRGARAAAIQF
jgi:hypothetical protein